MFKVDNFTDLILLVGTNPLPNYVVVEYFLSQKNSLRNIWLVSSEKTPKQEGTKEVGDNLMKLLKQKYSSIAFNIEVLSDVSNAKTIMKEVKDKIINNLDGEAKVHLNYTGGTKVMGNHVYRAIEKVNGVITNCESFSYLDGRNFCIVNDEGKIIGNNLRNEVWISFEDLIKLHGFKRINEDSDFNLAKASRAIDVFKKLINEDKLETEYFDGKSGGYKRELFTMQSNPNKLAKKKCQLDETLISSYKPNESFKDVMNVLPDEYKLFNFNIDSGKFTTNNNINDKEDKRNKNKKSEFTEAIDFINGGWLEYYVQKILIENFKGKINKKYILRDWEIKKDDWKRNKFQLDVILMNGYQLIGISCTLDEKKHVKNKGFEIIMRTRQIGGDEAKAVLITRAKNTDKEKTVDMLQEELRLETGGSDNILVLGRDDLKEEILFKKIEDFIK